MPTPFPPDHMTCHHTGHTKKCADLARGCWKWVEVFGTNPQTGELVSEWACNEKYKVPATLEVAKEVRGSAKSTDSLRNELISRIDNARPQPAQDAPALEYKQVP